MYRSARLPGLGGICRTIGSGRAQAAHRALTGLTTGWSGTAVAGLAAIATSDENGLTAVIFAALIGVVLILRRRVHADNVRRRILGGSGLAALAIALSVAAHKETRLHQVGK